jgi:hypothetical protein
LRFSPTVGNESQRPSVVRGAGLHGWAAAGEEAAALTQGVRVRVTDKRIRRWIPAVALLATAAACTSLARRSPDWTGHRISELIARRGPADRIMIYPYGGTLYIWESEEWPLAGRGPAALDESSTPGVLIHTDIALVSDAGIILRTQASTKTAGAD